MIWSVLHKFIRAALIIIPIILLGWLTVKRMVPSGKMEAIYDMRRETPFISKLYPKDRVSGIQKMADSSFYRILLDEPVYFDLKPNDVFEKVTVTVKYKNSGQAPLKMGGLINKKDWLFDWRDFSGGTVGWQTRKEFFEFSNFAPEGQKFRLGFSSSKMQAGEVEISEIKAVFEKKPMSRDEIIDKIFSTLERRLKQIMKRI